MAETPLPKTSKPASRAMESVGIRSLESLTDWSESDLLALHGVGPKAVRILREAMDERGIRFQEP